MKQYVLIVLLLFFLVEGYAGDAHNKALSVDFFGVTITEAVEILQPNFNKKIHVAYEDKKLFSLKVKELSPIQALTAVASQFDMVVRQGEHDLFIEKNVSVKPEENSLRQVEVEARIVNIDRSLEEALGFNLSWQAAGKAWNGDIKIPLPADVADVAKLGIGLSKLGLRDRLDLELSALERKGFAKIISKPSIVTTEKHQAVIESGEEIPYQQRSSHGASTVRFKKAVLSLKVTPEVLASGRVALDLEVTQNKRSGKALVTNIPAIDTRRVATTVNLADGETVVLGGIYETMHLRNVHKIPVLSSLPGIGRWFQREAKNEIETELLIFITPKIRP